MNLLFYSTFTRIWEYSFAVITINYQKLIKSAYFNSKFVSYFSILVIFLLFCFASFSAKFLPFIIIPVVISTSLLILIGEKKTYLKYIFDYKIFILGGKLSYSIYLWHFPVFAFGRLVYYWNPTFEHKITWIITSLGLSIISFYLIENPFRIKKF